MSEFELLAPPLRSLLLREGFTTPTAAQRMAIPPILAGKHVLLLAATGMGKTESAVLPVFHRHLAAPRKRGISILYVTPLRALNRDLLGRLASWGKELGIPVAVRHGDTPASERQRQSRDPPAMLITTPETVQVLLTGRNLRGHLAALRCVVVDEIHELSEDERGSQLAVALERLCRIAGEYQRVGLSATVGDPAAVAAFLGGVGRDVEVVKVPVAKRLSVRVESPEPTVEDEADATRIYARAEPTAHLKRALALVESHEATLLFVNTRETAEVLAARIRMLRGEYPVVVHHGSLSRDVRIAAEQGFKQAQARALICTSSMELGIDIGQADLVLQWGSPRQVARLVQRVGRAGHRADLVSNGVVIATDPDDAAEALVIARRAMDDKLERPALPKAPLDVLANQLVAMGVEGLRDLDTAFSIVARADPFRDLPRATFDAVVSQLRELRLLFADDGHYRQGKAGLSYFFENLSMIPDRRSFDVVNVASGGKVAVLDEDFVANFIEPQAVFICQGRPWRVLEIDSEKTAIRVEQVADPLGAIPSWIGEEIPVPFEVAQEVGALRKRIGGMLLEKEADDAVTDLARELPGTHAAIARVVGLVREQMGLVSAEGKEAPSYAIPTDTDVTLEIGDGKAILNVCLGTKGNETVGRVLSSLLSARLGTSVGLDTDPYRVILTLPRAARGPLVKQALDGIDPDGLDPLVHLIVTGSGYLRYRMLQVARKFGALSREADWRRVRAEKLVELFRGTPIHDEALREILSEKLDLAVAREALRKLRDGSWTLTQQGLSPIGLAGLDERRELISPARADATILRAVHQRLSEAKVVLACLNCCSWTSRTRPGDLPERPRCGKCGALTLAVLRPWHTNALKLVARHGNGKRPRLSEDERKEWRRLHMAANLVMSQGRRAVMALVARGVGPETGARLLLRQREDETSFLRDVLEAEVTYARTRAFWD
ncbi:MAG TPA: DEAD/DEAH box helicase [Candidatus Thermoplasmatota archaeon]|nr:DEAD/DEAH box helicase [Candidatus Thermoplasmatota archaeon]